MKYNFDSGEKEQKLFYARLDDLLKKADGGAVAHSDFLTPGEQYRAETYFSANGIKDRICCFGGYYAAERRQIFLLPEYMEGLLSDSAAKAHELLAEDISLAIGALKIEGSGYRRLTHRDYLGSILSLGTERSSVGDICMIDDFSAIVICRREIEGLLLSELSSVASDKVSVSEYVLDPEMPSKQSFESHSDTVASERLDCVIASLCNLSREKAQSLIVSGFAEVNYETRSRTDTKVAQGDIISVRGYGKFIIREISDRTKKGRIRLLFDKYV